LALGPFHSASNRLIKPSALLADASLRYAASA
jgi:hypothetical protein